MAIERIKCKYRNLRDDLKVHKNENFFGPDFEFCTISLLVLLKYYDFFKKIFFDWAINGGDTIVLLSLRLRRIRFRLV